MIAPTPTLPRYAGEGVVGRLSAPELPGRGCHRQTVTARPRLSSHKAFSCELGAAGKQPKDEAIIPSQLNKLNNEAVIPSERSEPRDLIATLQDCRYYIQTKPSVGACLHANLHA